MPLGAHKAAIMGVAGSEVELTLLVDNTFTDESSVSITSGITSKYSSYIFGFYNMNPATDSADLTFQVNVAGASGYNETIQSSSWRALHAEDDGTAELSYETSYDQDGGTAFQAITISGGNGADESSSGVLHLFNPGSTVYATNWYSRMSVYHNLNKAYDQFSGGYFNVTGAITQIQLKMSGGNMDGNIKMWGVP